MTPRAYPIKIEIYDHDDDGDPTSDPIALVDMQDEACASVEINTWVNATEWGALAAEISRALTAMGLKGDKR